MDIPSVKTGQQLYISIKNTPSIRQVFGLGLLEALRWLALLSLTQPLIGHRELARSRCGAECTRVKGFRSKNQGHGVQV